MKFKKILLSVALTAAALGVTIAALNYRDKQTQSKNDYWIDQ